MSAYWMHSAARLTIKSSWTGIIPVYLFTDDRMYIDWIDADGRPTAAKGIPTAQDYNLQVAKEGTYLLTDVFAVLGGGHMGNLFVRMYEVPQVHVHKGVETTYIGWGMRSHDREGRHYGMFWARA